MASKNQDIWLCIGLGEAFTLRAVSLSIAANLALAIVGYCAARATHKQLIAVRTAAQITKYNKPQDILSQRTENGMQANSR